MIAAGLTASDHKRLAQFVEATAGIQLPEHKRSLIEARLRKRQQMIGQPTLSAYIDYVLNQGAEERIMMIDALTTNKTDFFRESGHFEFLQKTLLERLPPSVSCSLRFWSAGCSTGEEPYTLAMVLEHVKQQRPRFSYRIEATDIAVSVLETARQAIYSHEQVKPVPLDYRKRFLLRKKNSQLDIVKMVPEIRRNVFFNEFNLITGDYGKLGQFDGIFCRNVMIYFNNKNRANIINNFYQALKPGGFFFIGHSEGLSGKNQQFISLIPTVYMKG